METRKKRSEWRKLVKKLQRKRKRQSKAKERDKKEEEEIAARQNDANYQLWLQQQTELEEFQKIAEERERSTQEEAWLRRELLAQKQFRLQEERRKANEAAIEAIRLQQEKELEERAIVQKKQREERERLQAEAVAEFERILQQMELYLSHEGSKTPDELRRYVETRPGQKDCEFYARTNCCQFGLRCTYNHRRPLLSRIILIHQFFVHPMLEESKHTEYEAADSHLEMNERDLRDDYDVFFEDTCAELENFGKIINFRCVRNTEPHLRGNVFVEYETKRSALAAFTRLQGRYYASRRLVVEFSNLVRWRGAVCGTCAENSQQLIGKIWDDVSPYVSRRNWRWSESPEPAAVPDQTLESETNSAIKNHRRSRSKESSRKKSLKERDRSASDSHSSSSHHRHKTKKRKQSREKSKRSTPSKAYHRKSDKGDVKDKSNSSNHNSHKKKTN